MTRRSRDRKLLPYPLDNPTDGQVPAFRASDGNLIWADAGGGSSGPTDSSGFIVHSSGFDLPGPLGPSTLTFTDVTRRLTIVGNGATYTYEGQRYTLPALVTVTIPDIEGLHYIYFEDDPSTPIVTQSFSIDIIATKVLVAVIYWDATNNTAIRVGDERHGNQMAPRTHIYNHLTFGTRYQAPGLGLINMDVDGNGDDASAAQFDVEAGTIWDEDIQFDIPATASGIPIFYRSGTNGEWRRGSVTGFNTITVGSGRMAYNFNVSGSIWTLSELANNDFGLVHYFATGDINEPVIGILGQGDFPTLGQARDAAPDELVRLSFGDLNELLPEFAPIATVIYQTSNGYSNAVKARVRSTDEGDDYIDWRGFIPVGGASGAGGTGGISAPATQGLFVADGDPLDTSNYAINTAALVTSWVPRIIDNDFAFVNGVLTIGASYDGKRARFTVHLGGLAANNRTMLVGELRNNSEGIVKRMFNYTTRDTNQDAGGICFSTIQAVTAGQEWSVWAYFTRDSTPNLFRDPLSMSFEVEILGDPP